MTMPVHRSRFMEENDINTTTLPAQSADINMIENTWLRLKRHLQSIKNRIYSQDQMISEITLFGKTLDKLYSSVVFYNSKKISE